MKASSIGIPIGGQYIWNAHLAHISCHIFKLNIMYFNVCYDFEYCQIILFFCGANYLLQYHVALIDTKHISLNISKIYFRYFFYLCDLQIWFKVIADIAKAGSQMHILYVCCFINICHIVGIFHIVKMEKCNQRKYTYIGHSDQYKNLKSIQLTFRSKKCPSC